MFRKKCLVCDSKNLNEIINLGLHPFADTFVPEEKTCDAEMAYPLICDLCENCGHIQTKCETSPLERYSKIDYSYTSSNSSFSRDHWDNYLKEVSNKISLETDSLVVEIGSNDGYLTEKFMIRGNRAIGVDPSPYMADLAKQRGVETVIGLFGSDISENILEKHGKARLIIANNVFNHTNNPLEFAKSVTKILDARGFFVFEQPYWVMGLDSKKFDQIYHEHVSYFTVKSISKLMEKAGMAIKYIEIVNYHGGSLRVYAQKKEVVLEEPKEMKKMIVEEENNKIFDSKTYEKFMRENLKNRSKFMQKIYKIKENGGSIIAVGAAAKGNTFLNFYKLDHSVIDYVTDASPHKKGKYTPLTRIPIVGDEVFSKYEEVYALILSWNIANQLKEKLYNLNPNIKFLVPD